MTMTFTPEQIVTVLVPTLTALAAFLQGRRNATKIEEIHLTVNSRLSELLLATEAAARSAGHAAGRAEEAAKEASQKAADAAQEAAKRSEAAAATVATGVKDAVTEAAKIVISAVKNGN